MAGNEEKLKSLLMRVKEECEKAGLNSAFKKLRSGPSPITSWQIAGKKVEIMTDFLSLGSKITVDGNCGHEIKTLAPSKESYDKPRQHIKKQRCHFTNKCP